MRAVTLLLLFLAACGGEQKQGLQRVVYAGSAWYGHAPVWVGVRKGIFEKHGFLVEPRAFGPSSDRVNALEADNAQFASLGEVAMLAAMSKDRRGFFWIGCQNIAPGNEGLVGVGVDSIAQLKGKTIALQERSSIHLTAALLLADAGLDITKDVEIKHATDSSIVDLVRRGDAVAGGIWEPFFTRLKQLKGAKLLATDKDTSIFRKYGMMTGPDVICASRRWVDADPERAERFFRAYWEAVEWCEANHAELIDIVVDEIKQPREEVEAALKNFRWLSWKEQIAMMSDKKMFGQAKEVSALLIRLGLMDKVPPVADWTHVDWFVK